MKRRLSLPLVYGGDELTGAAPAELERAARGCRSGDRTHKGLVFLCNALAHYGLRSCVPPSARGLAAATLDTAEGWALGRIDPSVAQKARSEAFAAVIAIEKKTIDAVRASRRRIDGKAHTELDPHADAVVLRYAGLAANHATFAALLTADGIEEPAKLADVPRQVAGAMAYLDAGLGPARSADLRAKAWGQAEWEAQRQGAPDGHPVGALAVQIFHEYLGAYWKDRSDGQRLQLGELAVWALAADAS